MAEIPVGRSSSLIGHLGCLHNLCSQLHLLMHKAYHLSRPLQSQSQHDSILTAIQQKIDGPESWLLRLPSLTTAPIISNPQCPDKPKHSALEARTAKTNSALGAKRAVAAVESAEKTGMLILIIEHLRTQMS